MADNQVGEAMGALLALGYTQGEVARAFAKIDTESLETEEIIKQGLKALARF